jgi:sterol desaturase/sphingolipid hydroxylase (fatty acid hydroxylase superfamily)
MPDLLLAQEPVIRLASFLGIFGGMVLWEVMAPRRPTALGRWKRWPGNLGILTLNALAVRLIFPAAAVGFAVVADEYRIGLFHLLDLPLWVAIAATILLLDLVIYFQHRIFHAVPALWRLHRMHHTDQEFDVTTGGRFHPLEIVLSMLVKAAAIFALGAPAAGVLIFEVLLNGTSMFNHGNVRMPGWLDRIVRSLLVTPDMHFVHHSTLRREHDSNFGFALSWWDRLFATYTPRPGAGYDGMTVGLDDFRDPREQGLGHLITQPFRGREVRTG